MTEAAEVKDDLVERALVHLDKDEKRAALALVMGWMSIDLLKVMVEFWDEYKQYTCQACSRPEWACSRDPCATVKKERAES